MDYIEIDGWKQNIRFSSAHIIPEHNKCGQLHGHSYAIHTKIYGKKDKKGFIIDFSQLKTILKTIADQLDHRILIPEKNKFIEIGKTEIKISIKEKHYVLPKEDCFILPIELVTAENLAEYILNRLIQKLKIPENVTRIEIGVDEGPGQGARVEKIVN